MTGANAAKQPQMMWAQTNDLLWLTICVGDSKDLKVNWDDPKRFVCTLADNEDKYACDIELYGEIKLEGSKQSITGRNVVLAIKKEVSAAYWPHLTATKQKLSWLKVDFAHWRDEDESGDEEAGGMGKGQPDMADLMSKMGDMGDMGDMGMGGMGLGGDMPDEESEDSDDDMPDLEGA